MARVRRFVLRLVNALLPGRAEPDVAREVAAHLRLLEDDFERRGMTPGQARLAARRAFGGVDQTRETHRDARSLPWLEDVRRDVHYGLRTLRRTPVFTAVAVATVALGIGATTAVFSVVSTTLLRPLPFRDADRLVRIVENVPAEESPSGTPVRTSAMSQDSFLWWRDHARTLSGMAAYLTSSVTVPMAAGVIRLSAARVSPSLFALLGAQPLAGRGLVADDERLERVAVLAASAWRRYFSSDRHIVGRTIDVDGASHVIVGVMDAGFAFPSPQTEIWTPYAVAPDGPNRIITVDVLAKLQDGVALAAASAEGNVVGNALMGLPPPGGEGAPSPPRFEVVGMQDQLVEPVRPALRVLMASVGVVLLIVCANIANLLLARGSARHRELGIRQALGAGRGRVVRQLLTESVVLSIAGGLAGTGLAFAGVRLIKTLAVVNLPSLYGGSSAFLPAIERVGIDAGVLTFTLAVCVGTGVIFGVVPALQLSRLVLPYTGGRASAPVITRARSGVRRILTVGQLALATMLLVGAGLLIHSFVKLSRVDLGYRPANVLTFELVLPPGVTSGRRLALANDMVAHLESLPKVDAAGFTGAAPLSTLQGGYVLRPPGTTSARLLSHPELRGQRANLVSPDYLRAIGARLVEGRWLDAHDGLARPHAILVNRALARTFFGARNPLGLSVYIGDVPWQVVGVVDDVRHRGLDVDPDPQAYVDPDRLDAAARAAGWDGYGFDPAPAFLSFAVRATGDPTSLVPDLRRLARRLDPLATIDGAVAMEEVVSGALARPRFYAVLLGLFAGIAAVIAAVGIYGVLSYVVTLRTHEMGIRMALGAQRRHVIGMVAREGSILTSIGVALGVAGAAGLTRYLRGMLVGVGPLDPITFIAVAIGLGLVATFASCAPARRATTVDPLIALRSE
jgi:predicted permease